MVGAGGKLQATVQASSKLYTLLQATGRILGRGVGCPGARGRQELLHGELLGRQHAAQLHARPDQPRLRFHAAQLELGSERHAADPDAGYGHGAAGSIAARGAHVRSGERAADLRERRQHRTCRIRRRAAPYRTGTRRSRSFSATRSPASDSWQGHIKFVAIHQRALLPRRYCRTTTPAWASATTCCSTCRTWQA